MYSEPGWCADEADSPFEKPGSVPGHQSQRAGATVCPSDPLYSSEKRHETCAAASVSSLCT